MAVFEDGVAEAAVDALERPGFQGVGDAADRTLGQRDQVWIAAHEGDGPAIGVGTDGIADEDCSPALGAIGPMQDSTASKVTAALDQSQAGQHFLLISPACDDRIRAADPALIVGGVPDWAVAEGVTEGDREAGQMRVTAGDGSNSAEVGDSGDKGVIDEAGRIPEDVAIRGADEQ